MKFDVWCLVFDVVDEAVKRGEMAVIYNFKHQT